MRTGDVVDGRYQLEDARGSGSGGIVWTAFDTKLKRPVALKKPHAMASQADRLRFRREAMTAAQVHHPNAVSVFDTVDGDECWLVMEYASADSLDKLLAAQEKLPPARVARIGLQIAAALSAVHARDIVHRDVKPGNILVDDNDFAKLTDFGISLWREVTLTQDGKFSGTPSFAAPEIAAGQKAAPASDIFSLGATLFAAVEGTPPFGTGDPDEVLRRVRRGEMRTMRHAGELAPLLSDMLAPEPKRRPTADQVGERLRRLVGDWTPMPVTRAATGRRPLWRRPVLQLVAAGLVVAATAGAVLLGGGEDPQPPPAGTDVIGDERTADPCALVDMQALAEFGATELRTSTGNFNRCDALIDLGAREDADVEIQLVNGNLNQLEGEPLDVISEPSDPDVCDHTVVVDDDYGVRVTVELANPSRDLCDIADVALGTVLDTLRAGQLRRRATPFPENSLAQVETCPLLDDAALAATPSIDPGSGLAGFGGWACKWIGQEDRQSVHLRYDRHVTLSQYEGESTRLGDREVYVELDDDSGTSCTVRAPHEPAGAPTRATTEVLLLTVAGTTSGADHCATALRLTAAAIAKLPN